MLLFLLWFCCFRDGATVVVVVVVMLSCCFVSCYGRCCYGHCWYGRCCSCCCSGGGCIVCLFCFALLCNSHFLCFLSGSRCNSAHCERAQTKTHYSFDYASSLVCIFRKVWNWCVFLLFYCFLFFFLVVFERLCIVG